MMFLMEETLEQLQRSEAHLLFTKLGMAFTAAKHLFI